MRMAHIVSEMSTLTAYCTFCHRSTSLASNFESLSRHNKCSLANLFEKCKKFFYIALSFKSYIIFHSDRVANFIEFIDYEYEY